MRYDAISFDTQTVMALGFHFERGLLEQLSQFKDNPTQVVVSEVVVREIIAKLTASTRAAADELAGAERKARDYRLILARSEPAPSARGPDPTQIAREWVMSYLRAIGAVVVPADQVPVRTLLDLYFKPGPPFSPTGKKKNEFPDAIALLSLEVWAESGNRFLLPVTEDKDWEAYASRSARIDVAKDLTHALALLQQHAEEAAQIVEHLLASVDENKENPLAVSLLDLLKTEVSAASFTAEAHSIFSAELWSLEVELKGLQLVSTGGAFRPVIVRAGKKEIVAQVAVTLSVEANASFSLSVYDSIDKDDVPMGSAPASATPSLSASVLITFEGDFGSDDAVEVTDASLVSIDHFIDFGEVEPDWGDDTEEEADAPF